MNKAVEILLHELDPRHDLERVIYMKSADNYFVYTGSIKDLLRNLIRFPEDVTHTANIPKHMIRGGIGGCAVGGLAGFVIAYATGESPSTCLIAGGELGFVTGVTIDMFQYTFRSANRIGLSNYDSSDK